MTSLTLYKARRTWAEGWPVVAVTGGRHYSRGFDECEYRPIADTQAIREAASAEARLDHEHQAQLDRADDDTALEARDRMRGRNYWQYKSKD